MSLGLGTRTWGNAGDEPGDTTFLTASWELASQVTGRLLDALPDVAVVRADEADPTLSGLLAREVQRDLPGQDVVLDRLVDLVLIEAVRQWFSRAEDSAPSWWRAGSDPLVGRALAALHDEPGHPWTLDVLAAHVHVSRATLSRRFSDLVGQSPMAYLTHWRLARAADLLRVGQPQRRAGRARRRLRQRVRLQRRLQAGARVGAARLPVGARRPGSVEPRSRLTFRRRGRRTYAVPRRSSDPGRRGARSGPTATGFPAFFKVGRS